MIREFQLEDTQQLLDIYNYYVLNSVVTFDDKELSFEQFTEKVNKINAEYPFLVFEENNEILGYAYGSRFRPKPAYQNTVESTIYLKHSIQGKGIGTKLYSKLIEVLKQQKLHIVLGVLTLPNEASVKLHEKLGFKKVAHLEEVGLKFGKWQDVGVYQLKLST
ncbi:GNAT family N-acetyltransferase [Seonamhaeicola maritimus]|uniref:N-acetyltransferase n=1 Tax=Seonamhaeicola maritimus TaxID=2591822 RepID=A0A5C7GLD4_9FLAO|nr:GNAT family N-acetyltransferase [Seonamhaeicola maritimus]TXG38897.1 N-acetyltransferase [Seonamhaeicola maritimus]